MTCTEIIQKLEELSPPSFAEDWDNSGLLAGRRDKEVKTVAIALDASGHVIEEAVRVHADMLITHHPLIFKPLKQVDTGNFVGRRLVRLIQKDIAYYAMHTNFDVMGMADAAADELALKNRLVLSITYEDEIAKEGIGRYGKLPSIMTLEECAEYVKQTFDLEQVRVCGEQDRIVETAAISPGAGGDMIADALRAKVDVLITGDMKHHEVLDAMEQGMAIIDADHFGLEKLFSAYIQEFLKRECPAVCTCVMSEKSPFRMI